MDPCDGLLMKLREKLFLAKDVLRAEKLNLRTTDELLVKEKDDVAKELAAEKKKIYDNDEKIRWGKQILKEKKTNCEEILKLIGALSEQQEGLKKELKKNISSREIERHNLILEQETLEKKLVQINRQQEQLKESNLWTKISQEKELKAIKAENDTKLENETKFLSKDSAKKTNDLFEALKEIRDIVLRTKQEEINKLQEKLFKLTVEYERLEKKNANIEEEIKNENHFRNVYLWGIILGQEADYYVAYGYEKDALFGRKFFYSTNMLDWGVMPTPDDTAKRLTEICFQRFQGDPALVLEVADDDPGPSPEQIEKRRQEICLAGGDPADIMEEVHSTVAQLKEEDRLAATVDIINQEVVVVPRGVLMKQPEGLVVLNKAFEGLPYEESEDLKSYVHYRKPLQKWNTNLITRKDYNYALDFLDTIDLDLPKGCWSIQKEKGGRLIILRSLYWPGLTSYHWCETPDWGYLYFGNGRKDLDVPFMIYS